MMNLGTSPINFSFRNGIDVEVTNPLGQSGAILKITSDKLKINETYHMGRMNRGEYINDYRNAIEETLENISSVKPERKDYSNTVFSREIPRVRRKGIPSAY